MKKTMLKIAVAALCVLLVLDATGGTLAQPERQGREQDRFVGVHMVYERMPKSGEGRPRDESHWVEYGSEDFEIEGLGSVALPRKILIGRFDKDTHRYDFPGMEGQNCFMATEILEDGSELATGYSGLMGANLAFGDEQSLSGTVYYGPPLDDVTWNTNDFDYIWTAYQVYRMEDGTVYLDGSGNSYGGVGDMGMSCREEYTTTVNGEKQTTSFEISVNMEAVERLERVDVKWFDADAGLLAQKTLPWDELTSELELPKPEGAVWVLVEELDQTGRVERTVHTFGQPEGVAHQLVLLDEAGLGRVEYLTLEPASETV